MKILVVDDHPIVRAGLRRLLSSEPNIEIREATDSKQALSLYREQRPMLVILDLNLPGLGGLELLGRLKAADPDARILVLSMHDDETHVTRALQAGAMGYVTKNAPPDELLEAIRLIADGRTYIEREIAEALVFTSLRSSSHPLKELSSRDLEILRLLAHGCTLPQVADTLGIGYKTAANNCTRIKAKLGAATTGDLIRITIRSGLVDGDSSLSPVGVDSSPRPP